MVATVPPWHMSLVPNVATASPVEVVRAEEMDRARFQRYLDATRPCLIKGVPELSPIAERWSSRDHLLSRCGDPVVSVARTPHVERDSAPSGAAEKMRLSRFLDLTMEKDAGRSLGDERSTSPGYLCLFGQDLVPGGVLGELAEDVANFPDVVPFVRCVNERGNFPPGAVFFYRRSFTDWHFHPQTEALMCQVIGAKDVLLYPPDRYTWSKLSGFHAGGPSYVQRERFTSLRPYHARVEQGDILYIPINWWHAVWAYEEGFGSTMTIWWDAAMKQIYDPRMPASLRTLKSLTSRFASELKSACLAIVAPSISRS